jgi:myo-inositol 2-dehydrogenase / D-chiro-inositol 1-dehydrogenase
MNEIPIRIAVLGAGRIGRMHAEMIARRVPGAELACVFDVAQGLAAAVAGELRAPSAASVDEAMGPDSDAVAICTSTDTHVSLIEAAARAGKHIFCEKPVSMDLALVDRALAVVADCGVKLHVGFNRRFDPAHCSVRDAVVSGRIGQLELVRITSRDPAPPPISYLKGSGGIFLDMTVHDFDMARFVTASEVVEVYADGGALVDPAIGAIGDIDTAVVVLRHQNGCMTTIDNSRRAAYGYDQRIEAFGSAGLALSENPTVHSGSFRGVDGGHTAVIPKYFLDRYFESYVLSWRAFVDYARSGETSPVSGEEGRAPIVIALAAQRSLREHRPVKISEIDSRIGAHS